MSVIDGNRLKSVMDDFKDIINQVITAVIIPVLPLYIFGIFLNMTNSGQVAGVMNVFLKIIVVIFVMTVVLLFIQFLSPVWSVKESPPFVPQYVTCLYDCFRHPIFGGNDSCNPGANDTEWRTS